MALGFGFRVQLGQRCRWCGSNLSKEIRGEVAAHVRLFGLAAGVRLCRCGQMVGRRVGRKMVWIDARIEPASSWSAAEGGHGAPAAAIRR